VAKHFEPVLEQRLASLEALTGWAPRVAVHVRRHLVETETEPTLAGVASALNVSPRSLQRYLTAEEKTFQDVLDECRRDLARQWLSARKGTRACNMTELALILGFSSSSAFSRAFRRWFDMTPGQAAKDGIGE
jgi:AraC-like DNA-binding protein